MRLVEGESSRQAGLISSKKVLSCCRLQLLNCPGYSVLQRWGRGRCYSSSRIRSSAWELHQTHPTLSDMMQPLFVVWEPQTQFSASWDKPRLWPISCAMVEATPTGDGLWSCRWAFHSLQPQLTSLPVVSHLKKKKSIYLIHSTRIGRAHRVGVS